MEKPTKIEGIKNPSSIEERVKTKLKTIFDEYGYIDEIRRKKILGILVMDYSMGMVLEGDNNFISPDNYEVANLIKVLRQCKEVVVTGVIENPQNDKERKGQATKTKICAEYTFLHLDYFLNTLLEYQQDGFYQYQFKWEFKDEIDYQNNPFNFTEPYTKIELEQIIEYEKEKYINNLKELTSRQKIGKRLSFIEEQMQQEGFFSKKSEGKAKEYAFLFDCFVNIGKIPIPEYRMTDSEKYSFVKESLKTYDNYKKTAK